MVTSDDIKQRYEEANASFDKNQEWAVQMRASIEYRAHQLYVNYDTFAEAYEAAEQEIFDTEADNQTFNA